MEPSMEVLASEGFITGLCKITSVSEVELRVFLTILAGYPLALIHRSFIHDKPANLQHLYFILGGLSFGFFNYGLETLHAAFTVAFSFLTLVAFGGTSTGVAITFIFNMSYLLLGYYHAGTNEYDINWTLPQCVMVLRLIGLSFDLYDGNQPEDGLGEQNKRVALKTRPTILEYFGHMFFPTCYMIGPLFSMRRYQSFIAGEFSQGDKSQPPNSMAAGTKRLLIGIGYLILYRLGSTYVNNEYLLSDDYASSPFWMRAILMAVWTRQYLYRYISFWLFTEGACIMFGLTYNGKDAEGTDQWDGVSNVTLSVFENSTRAKHYVQSFNTNTNQWVAQYVFKRLKFLGNRYLSQIASLFFLALWHGFHSGYYVMFFLEFFLDYMEKDVLDIFAKNPHLDKYFEPPAARFVWNTLKRLYGVLLLGWALPPFGLLLFERYWAVYSADNYIGLLAIVPWPFLWGPLVRMAVKASKPSMDEEIHKHID